MNTRVIGQAKGLGGLRYLLKQCEIERAWTRRARRAR